MFGPGAYRPDPTEGITALADLPQPEIVLYSRNDTRQPCPRCGHSASRDKQSHRTLHDLGHLDVWCPRDLVLSLDSVYEYERAISENAHGTLLMHKTQSVSGESHGVHHQLLSEPPMHALW